MNNTRGFKCFCCGGRELAASEMFKSKAQDVVCTPCRGVIKSMWCKFEAPSFRQRAYTLRRQNFPDTPTRTWKKAKDDRTRKKYGIETAQVRGVGDKSHWPNPCVSDVLKSINEFYLRLHHVTKRANTEAGQRRVSGEPGGPLD